VKEFWKSVKICRSYCHEFGGLLFGTRTSVCLSVCLSVCPSPHSSTTPGTRT